MTVDDASCDRFTATIPDLPVVLVPKTWYVLEFCKVCLVFPIMYFLVSRLVHFSLNLLQNTLTSTANFLL